MLNQTPSQQLEMLHGHFEPTEARTIVKNFYTDAINAYKIQKLRHWMANHNSNTSVYDQLIKDLEIQKKEMNHLIDEAEKINRPVEFSGNISAKLVA